LSVIVSKKYAGYFSGQFAAGVLIYELRNCGLEAVKRYHGECFFRSDPTFLALVFFEIGLDLVSDRHGIENYPAKNNSVHGMALIGEPLMDRGPIFPSTPASSMASFLADSRGLRPGSRWPFGTIQLPEFLETISNTSRPGSVRR